MVKKLVISSICAMSLAGVATAQSTPADVTFNQLFLNAAGLQNGPQHLHYPLDQNLWMSLHSTDLTGAMLATRSSTINTLNEVRAPKQTVDVDAILRKKQITLVIVPGIFGEFIPNRAFEEVFAANSSAKRAFANSVKNRADLKESVFNLQQVKEIPANLDQILSVASIDDAAGQPLVKIVLLTTPMASLETLVDVKEQSDIFIRRLQKYLSINNDQNLVLVGYSRGASTALEMLYQAQKNNSPWLSKVRGVVSLGGVVMGSTLADDAMSTQGLSGALIEELMTVVEKLEPSNDRAVIERNNQTWREFAEDAAKILAHKMAPPTPEDLLETLENFGNPEFLASLAVDIRGPLKLAKEMFLKLGLDAPIKDYVINIQRFKKFMKSTVTGVRELTTAERIKWWQTHEVPTVGIRYYGLAGTFVHPRGTDVEREIWKSRQGYNISYDTMSLLGSFRKYENLTDIALNDSQVSFAQVQFMPKVLQGLNSKQKPINATSLGVVATHHWGLALQTVYPMMEINLPFLPHVNDKNPFPRRALLKALAAQVVLDQSAQ